MTGLLDGMRVLDVSMWRPMPHATQILADLGAEVLKIEQPGGDPMRGYPEIFASLARNKRSIELNLKDPEQHARALELVADCDVFCEAWRPGVAERLGLGADILCAARPSLIYCSISGYGQFGPWRDAPGHDLNYQALGGAIAPRDGDRETPSIPKLPAADLEAGTLAALLVCAAWSRRLVTGEGERIDVAMADVMAWWVGPRSVPTVGTEGARPGGSPGYGVFRTFDDRFVTLAPLSEPHLWRAICNGLALDDLAEVPFEVRIQQLAAINDRVSAAIAALTFDEAVDRLLTAGAPVAPVLSAEEAATHPQFVARELLTAVDGLPVPVTPALLDVHPRRAAGPVPSVGEHGEGFSRRDRGR